MSDTTPFKLIPKYKQIHDIVHGYINISNLAQMIIDTCFYQKLHRLKQLGTCVYVFPTAKHSRYEHSLGAYHLAGRLIKTINEYSDKTEISKCLGRISELKEYFSDKKIELDDYVQELIKISSLCHDIGHGINSHLFQSFQNDDGNTHEYRSGMIIETIINRNEILKKVIRPSEIKLIKKMIDPGENDNGFIFEITSNKKTGLDIDKYDYIMRDTLLLGYGNSFDCSRLINDVLVIDDRICYPKQIVPEIYKLFQTRYLLHKQVYSHKMTISAQLMMIELLQNLDPLLGISTSVNDMDEFLKMTDDYIMTSVDYLTSSFCMVPEKYKKNIQEAKILIDRLNSHNLFACVGTLVSNADTEIKIDESLFVGINMDNIVLHRSTIGYYSGKKHDMFADIFVFSTKKTNDNIVARKVKSSDISFLISDNHQENIVLIFYKDRNDTKTIDLLRKRFQQYI